MIFFVFVPLLGLVVLAAHWPALNARALTCDDDQYLVHNHAVQNPSWSSARRFFEEVLQPSTVTGYYQPLTMLSLMLDCAAGASPNNLRPLHVTNLGLHVANSMLVMVLLCQLFGRVWPALLVALTWGLHPLTVEPICWISQRKTLLAALFSLICLVLYVHRAARAGKSGKLLYSGSLLAFLLALLSKPTATPLALMLLIVDYWPLGRLFRPASSFRPRAAAVQGRLMPGRSRRSWTLVEWRVIVEKIPFLALACLFGLITLISQARSASIITPAQHSWWHSPLVIAHNIVFYLQKIFWPLELSAHYPFPDPMNLSHTAVLAGVIGTLVLLVALIVSWRWTPAPAAGGLMFFLMLLPTMQVVGFTNVIAANHFVYLPLVGLLIVFGWGLTAAWYGSGGRLPATGGRLRRGAVLAVLAVLVTREVRQARAYLAVWKDTDRLYQHMLAICPEDYLLKCAFGRALAREGKPQEALRELAPLVQQPSNDGQAELNFSFALMKSGRSGEALPYLWHAVSRRPRDANAFNLLGLALAEDGDPTAGEQFFMTALQLKPDNVMARMNYGRFLLLRQRYAEAERQYRAVVRISPRMAFGWAGLAKSLRLQGRLEEACRAAEQAVVLSPQEPGTHFELAQIYESQGRLRQAVQAYRRVVEIDSGNVTARERLRAIQASAGTEPP